MQSPTQCPLDHFKLSYASHFETLYNGQAVHTDGLEYHCMFQSDLIHSPKFTDKIYCRGIVTVLYFVTLYISVFDIMAVQ